MEISLRRHHAVRIGDGAFSHKIDWVKKFEDILNLEGHLNRITGSKVRGILLNGWILPIGGVASGRVRACAWYNIPSYPLSLREISEKLK